MRALTRLLAFALAFSLTAQPVLAQSILRDAETEELLQELADPLVEAAGLQPGNVDIVLINDPSINAFVAGGQAVYIHSGLINAADNANEVQGVIAHELGHITGGHIVRYGEGAQAASNISLLSLLLGVGAAVAGAGDAAMGVMMAGQRAALGKFLAFTRVQESSADAAGAQYLAKAGISGKGSLSFFGKLQNQAMRYGYDQSDEASFNQTHPMSAERITRLREDYVNDPAWDRATDPALEARFQRIKGKLYGYLAEPKRVLTAYPEYDTRIEAHYARAYAYHKAALVDKALGEADTLLTYLPKDPYFLELKGQILLESGKPSDALPALRQATEYSGHQPLIAAMFGHALIATEDPENYEEAERVLRAAVALDRLNPFAWHQLGQVYAARVDMPRARLASAEQQVMSRSYTQALRSAQAAEAGLEVGSPDWIRAQDIALQARAELERIRDEK